LRIVTQVSGARSITLHDLEPTPDRICEDVCQGLSARPKKLPPKYFYDERGAALFERITDLAAYYPTRTEISILLQHAEEIAERIGPRVRLVEFGSGSGEKTWILLRHLREPSAYIPVDISRAQLVEFALEVAETFPQLDVVPICADYTHEFSLPPFDEQGERCVAFFPGSTIGNFEEEGAVIFLTHVRRLVGPDGGLLIGVDLLKDRGVIEQAYNDPEGVTAEFNLNLLSRINRECGANFDVASFRHHAFFDSTMGRIEMRLVSEVQQAAEICADLEDGVRSSVSFDAGEYITTEYSQKYDLAGFANLTEQAGWRVRHLWTDPKEWFAVILLG